MLASMRLGTHTCSPMRAAIIHTFPPSQASLLPAGLCAAAQAERSRGCRTSSAGRAYRAHGQRLADRSPHKEVPGDAPLVRRPNQRARLARKFDHRPRLREPEGRERSPPRGTPRVCLHGDPADWPGSYPVPLLYPVSDRRPPRLLSGTVRLRSSLGRLCEPNPLRSVRTPGPHSPSAVRPALLCHSSSWGGFPEAQLLPRVRKNLRAPIHTQDPSAHAQR